MSGPTLIAAAGAAIAAIGEAGGTADTIAMSPTAYAAELTATDADGRLVHPDGLTDLIGLDIVQVPGLDPPLVYDAGRCFLVLGQDSNVTMHDDPHHDAMLLLVKARANVGVPVKDKAIRKLDITEPARAGGAASGQDQVTSSPPSPVTASPALGAWAPPLDPPAAGGLPVDQAQAIAAAWWDHDPHLCAALQWEHYAATLPMTPTVSQVATGAQSVSYSPAQPAGSTASRWPAPVAQVVHDCRVGGAGGPPRLLRAVERVCDRAQAALRG